MDQQSPGDGPESYFREEIFLLSARILAWKVDIKKKKKAKVGIGRKSKEYKHSHIPFNV